MIDIILYFFVGEKWVQDILENGHVSEGKLAMPYMECCMHQY